MASKNTYELRTLDNGVQYIYDTENSKVIQWNDESLGHNLVGGDISARYMGFSSMEAATDYYDKLEIGEVVAFPITATSNAVFEKLTDGIDYKTLSTVERLIESGVNVTDIRVRSNDGNESTILVNLENGIPGELLGQTLKIGDKPVADISKDGNVTLIKNSDDATDTTSLENPIDSEFGSDIEVGDKPAISQQEITVNGENITATIISKDASLTYTGKWMHKDKDIGVFDTVLSKDDTSLL